MVYQCDHVTQFSGIDISGCLKKNSLIPEADLLYANLLLLQENGLLGELYGIGLDVGAGRCRNIPVLQRLGVKEVYAIDLNFESREKVIARGIIDKNHYVPADASYLASIFGENAFDVVAAFAIPIDVVYGGNIKFVNPDELQKLFDPPNERFKEGWTQYVKTHPYIFYNMRIIEASKRLFGAGLKENYSEWDKSIPRGMAKVLKPGGTILISAINIHDITLIEDSLRKCGVQGKYIKIAKEGEAFLYIGEKT